MSVIVQVTIVVTNTDDESPQFINAGDWDFVVRESTSDFVPGEQELAQRILVFDPDQFNEFTYSIE